ncbi:MAG: hypothetical protein HY619_05355 [Thaumarchaeota archaeon]|nr:hypothetical protein [Nitrososphaerota archaeon]
MDVEIDMVSDLVEIVRPIALVFLVGALSYRIGRLLMRPSSRTVIPHILLSFFGSLSLSTIIRTFSSIWNEIVLQRFIARRGMIRWYKHYLIFFGGAGLLVFHGLPRILLATTEEQLFPWAQPDLRVATHYLFFASLAVGATVSTIRHLQLGDARGPKGYYHWVPLFAIFAISASGALAFQLEYMPSLYAGPSTEAARSVFYAMHLLIVYFVVATFPLTKFFHVLVRFLAPLAAYYKVGLETVDMAKCVKCGKEFATRQQVDDVKKTLTEIDPALYDLCPKCRRRNWARKVPVSPKTAP